MHTFLRRAGTLRFGIPARIGLGIAALLLALCATGVSIYERALVAEARHRSVLHLETHARAFNEVLANRLGLLRGLGAFIETELDDGANLRLGERFVSFSRPLLASQLGIRNFSLAPGAVQRWVYPLDGNAIVAGHDLLNDSRPDVAAGVRRALDSHDIVIGGPYQLRQGGQGLVARLAVRHRGAVWGLAAMVLDLPPLLKASGIADGHDGLVTALVDQDGRLIAGSGDVLAQDPVATTVALPQAAWQLLAVPRVGWRESIATELWHVRLAGWGVTGALVLAVLMAIRRQTRAALLASERRFRDLAGVSADWFWEMDADLRLTYCFGAEGQQDLSPLVGLSFGTLAERHLHSAGELAQLLAGRSTFRNRRIVWRRSTGRYLHLDVSGLPLFDRWGRFTGYRGTCRDATAERAAMAELEAATEARAAAEAESRAKSAFLAKMSHELRTPLNAILGFSDAIVSEVFGPVQPTRYRDYAEYIFNSGKHLLEVIGDLLDLSLIEAGKLDIKPQVVGLRELVYEVVGLARPLAARRHNRFDFSLDGDALLVIDPTRVRQVLLNVLGNACKFTSDGLVRLDASMRDGKVVFRVQDTGIGIAPEDMDKLFLEFSRLDGGKAADGQGTGLGLSICRRLCHLMGGEITVESTPGSGSCFTVTLPSLGPPG